MSEVSGESGEDETYLVVVKPSARKSNAAVGKWVNRNGPSRQFASKAHAREWARECAGPGAFVWVQDAVPWDESRADGYLVGGSRWVVTDAAPGSQTTLGDK